MVERGKWALSGNQGSMAEATDLAETIVFLLFGAEANTLRTWAIIVAGTFVLIALALSSFLIFEHLTAYKNPEEQKFLIGVILMVPCYATESFVSLVNPAIDVDCEILRDCYEAFAMYCFGRYLIACLGGEERTIEFMKRQGRANAKTPLLEPASEKGFVKHPFPLNYFFKPWRLGQWFFQVVKFGIVQYMILKTFCALLALVLETFGVYGEGEFKWNYGYPYIAVVLNFSQSWALYCLVQFYTVTKDELEPIKPLAKFLVFKSIVFLTWWQGVAIAVLYSLGIFKGALVQGLEFKSSIQDFIICLEMGVASIVHVYVFPSKPYELMGDRCIGSVAVMADYASIDSPLDPEEVKDSERPTKMRLPQSDVERGGAMSLKDSFRDVVFGGGEYIVNDVKFTVSHAVEPVEKGFTRINETIHQISQNIKKHEREKKHTKDDSYVSSSQSANRIIRGIDDPLLTGSISDSGIGRSKKHRSSSGNASADSGGESSDHGRFEFRGRRWTSKD